jgi:uncharacterized membrane protein
MAMVIGSRDGVIAVIAAIFVLFSAMIDSAITIFLALAGTTAFAIRMLFKKS